MIIPVDTKVKLLNPPFKIKLQDFPYQIDNCVSMKKLFVLARSETSNSSSLYVFNYNKEQPARPPV